MNPVQLNNCQNCELLAKKIELFDLLKQKCSRSDEIAVTLMQLSQALERAQKLLISKQTKLNESKSRLKELEGVDLQFKAALVRIVSSNAQIQEYQQKLTEEQNNHSSTQKKKTLVEEKLQSILDENTSLKLINHQLEERSLAEQQKASDDLTKSKKVLKSFKDELRKSNSSLENLKKKHDKLVSSLLKVAAEENITEGSLKKVRRILSTLKSKDEVAKLEAELNSPTLTPDGTTSSDAGVFSGDEDVCSSLSRASLCDDLDLSSDDEFEEVPNIAESISCAKPTKNSVKSVLFIHDNCKNSDSVSNSFDNHPEEDNEVNAILGDRVSSAIESGISTKTPDLCAEIDNYVSSLFSPEPREVSAEIPIKSGSEKDPTQLALEDEMVFSTPLVPETQASNNEDESPFGSNISDCLPELDVDSGSTSSQIEPKSPPSIFDVDSAGTTSQIELESTSSVTVLKEVTCKIVNHLAVDVLDDSEQMPEEFITDSEQQEENMDEVVFVTHNPSVSLSEETSKSAMSEEQSTLAENNNDTSSSGNVSLNDSFGHSELGESFIVEGVSAEVSGQREPAIIPFDSVPLDSNTEVSICCEPKECEDNEVLLTTDTVVGVSECRENGAELKKTVFEEKNSEIIRVEIVADTLNCFNLESRLSDTSMDTIREVDDPPVLSSALPDGCTDASRSIQDLEVNVKNKDDVCSKHLSVVRNVKNKLAIEEICSSSPSSVEEFPLNEVCGVGNSTTDNHSSVAIEKEKETVIDNVFESMCSLPSETDVVQVDSIAVQSSVVITEQLMEHSNNTLTGFDPEDPTFDSNSVGIEGIETSENEISTTSGNNLHPSAKECDLVLHSCDNIIQEEPLQNSKQIELDLDSMLQEWITPKLLSPLSEDDSNDLIHASESILSSKDFDSVQFSSKVMDKDLKERCLERNQTSSIKMSVDSATSPIKFGVRSFGVNTENTVPGPPKTSLESATSPLKQSFRNVSVNTETVLPSSQISGNSLRCVPMKNTHEPNNESIGLCAYVEKSGIIGNASEGIHCQEISSFSLESEILKNTFKVLKISPIESGSPNLNTNLFEDIRQAVLDVLEKNNPQNCGASDPKEMPVLENDSNRIICTEDPCEFAELCKKQHFEFHRALRSASVKRNGEKLKRLVQKPHKSMKEQRLSGKLKHNIKKLDPNMSCDVSLRIETLPSSEPDTAPEMDSSDDCPEGELCIVETSEAEPGLESSAVSTAEWRDVPSEACSNSKLISLPEQNNTLGCDTSLDKQKTNELEDKEGGKPPQNSQEEGVASVIKPSIEEDSTNSCHVRRSERLQLLSSSSSDSECSTALLTTVQSANCDITADNVQSFDHQLPSVSTPRNHLVGALAKLPVFSRTKRKHKSESDEFDKVSQTVSERLQCPLRLSSRQKKLCVSKPNVPESMNLNCESISQSSGVENVVEGMSSDIPSIAYDTNSRLLTPTTCLLENGHFEGGLSSPELSSCVTKDTSHQTQSTVTEGSQRQYPDKSSVDSKPIPARKATNTSSQKVIPRLVKMSKLEKLRSRVSRVHPLAHSMISTPEDHKQNQKQVKTPPFMNINHFGTKQSVSQIHAEEQEKLKASALQKIREKGILPLNAAASGRTAVLIDGRCGLKRKRPSPALKPSCPQTGNPDKASCTKRIVPLIRPEDRLSSMQIENQKTSHQDVAERSSLPKLQAQAVSKSLVSTLERNGLEKDMALQEPHSISSSNEKESGRTSAFFVSENSSFIVTSGKPMDLIISKMLENQPSSYQTEALSHTESTIKQALKNFVAAPVFTSSILQKTIDVMGNKDLMYSESVITRDIVGCVEDDFDTPLTRVKNPTSCAPVLTPVQQQLVTLTFQLSFQHEHLRQLPQDVLKLIEYRVFRLGKAPEGDRAVWLARLYSALCRALLLRSKALVFCWDAMYSFKLKANSIILTVLDVWPSLLPYKTDSENACPNFQVMVHFLVSQVGKSSKKKESQEANNLKKIMLPFCSSQCQNSQMLLSKLSADLISGNMNTVPPAIVLLAKREGEKWALDHVVNAHLLPALESWRKGDLEDIIAERVVWVLCSILRPLQTPDANPIISTTLKLFSSDLLAEAATVSPTMQEAIVIGLTLLSRHDIEKVAFSLLPWQPAHASTRGLSPYVVDHLTALVKNSARDLKWWLKVCKSFGNRMEE